MAKRIIKKRIGELLIERGAITQQQLQQALALQKKKGGQIGQVLVQLGFVSEEQVAQALTVQYGFPYLPLESYEIDEELLEVVPESMARKYCLMPVDRIGNALTLAMADPSNVDAVRDVEMVTKCVVQTCVSTPTEISKAIERYYAKADDDGAEPPQERAA